MYARCSPSAAFTQDFNTNFLYISNSRTAKSELVSVSQNHEGEFCRQEDPNPPAEEPESPESRNEILKNTRSPCTCFSVYRENTCTVLIELAVKKFRAAPGQRQGSARAAPSLNPPAEEPESSESRNESESVQSVKLVEIRLMAQRLNPMAQRR